MARFEAKISIATDDRFTEVNRTDNFDPALAVAKALATLADSYRHPKLTAIADAAWTIAALRPPAPGVPVEETP